MIPSGAGIRNHCRGTGDTVVPPDSGEMPVNVNSYRLDRVHQVVELRDIARAADMAVFERHLHGLLGRCKAPAVILELTDPALTPAAVQLLVRARRFTERRGIFLCVTARSPQVAETLREAGLENILRVTRTFDEARARTAVCCPAPPAPLTPRVGTRVRSSLYRFVRATPGRRSGGMAAGQH